MSDIPLDPAIRFKALATRKLLLLILGEAEIIVSFILLCLSLWNVIKISVVPFGYVPIQVKAAFVHLLRYFMNELLRINVTCAVITNHVECFLSQQYFFLFVNTVGVQVFFYSLS